MRNLRDLGLVLLVVGAACAGGENSPLNPGAMDMRPAMETGAGDHVQDGRDLAVPVDAGAPDADPPDPAHPDVSPPRDGWPIDDGGVPSDGFSPHDGPPPHDGAAMHDGPPPYDGPPAHDGPPAQDGPPPLHHQTPACGSEPPLSSPLVDATHLSAILPLGNLSPPGHTLPTTHTYLMLPVTQGAAGEGPFGDGRLPAKIEVRAPGNVRVVEIKRSIVDHAVSPGVTTRYIEDGLTAHVCGTRFLSLGHILLKSTPVEAAIAALDAAPDPHRRNCHSYSTGGDTVSMCRYLIDVPVAAGAVIAETSGRAFALDVGGWDTSMPSARIGAGTRFVEELGYTACAWDWFTPALKATYHEKFGEQGPGMLTARTAEPRCGRADLDRKGTALGNWYLRAGPMDFEPEDFTVALALDPIDPNVPVFSIGNPDVPSFPRGLYTFTPGVDGPRFEDVTTGMTACFTVRPHRDRGSVMSGKVVLVTLAVDPGNSREILRIAAAPGTCASPPTPATTLKFER